MFGNGRAGIEKLSFPSISTGAYGYPAEKAAAIALRTVLDLLAQGSSVREVTFVLFDARTLRTYHEALKRLTASEDRPAG